MALPTIDEFLASLNRLRGDSQLLRDDALAHGDGRAARTFQEHSDQIERMIVMKGGHVDA